MRSTMKSAFAVTVAAIVLGAVAPRAEDAKPADASLANQLDPNAKETDQKTLAASQATAVEGGKYKDKDGDPTFHVTDNGKKVDWYTYSGFRRYHSECHVCHGPEAMGSTYAPALKDSLKHLSYGDFMGIVAGGKKDVNASSNQVMPSFADNRNVMCYADDIYVYIRARAAGAFGRGRPGEKEDKPADYSKNEADCLSPK